ncbi:AbrB family transcriptional regulator [Ancylobacter sp. A5.8]|uniref:AbrB family transcriptional regulator n=1 Tax=Ancylobacter gelatini TaxID=2919920 RepID=UPI001F4DD012|nr:AbrB family transcriptional regulator [Ancylobacter gelatini]MCJ8143937.1 AbrB family transcriptional regulator [Ancylobacter gelatini]
MVTLFHTAAALLIGAVGGYVFVLLHAPLPWTLGALTATALVSLAGRRWFLPPFAWNLARPCIGVLAGSSFTLPILLSLAGWWDVILILVVYSLAMTLLGSAFFRRVAGYDPATSFFASAPAGLGELSLLGSSLGGNLRTLVLVHSVRIVLVVFTVPFAIRWMMAGGAAPPPAPAHVEGAGGLIDWALLIGCGVIGFFLGRPYRTFGGVMLVPMVLSAIVHIAGFTTLSPPAWLVTLVQITIGSIAGSRFAGLKLAEFRSTIMYALVWAVTLVVTAFLAAMACLGLTEHTLAELALGFAPGGIVEMTIVAYAMSVEVAFVVTCQLSRITLVLMLAPVLFRLTGHKPPAD